MSDERPDSLAAQAASWVPPWERAARAPDPEYAAAHQADSGADDDEQLSEAGLADEDDDFDPASEGANPAEGGTGVPAELPPVPGERGTGPATVDAPREIDGDDELDPTDVGGGPELPVPDAISEAAENEIGSSPVVDAPLPSEGDDAGDVFDQAADDDVTDDDDIDLPVVEEVPAPDEDEDELGEAEAEGASGNDTAAAVPGDGSGRVDGGDGPEGSIVGGSDAPDAGGTETEAGPGVALVPDDGVAATDVTSAVLAAGAGGAEAEGPGDDGGAVGAGNAVVGEGKASKRAASGGGVPAQGRRGKKAAVAVVEPFGRTDTEVDVDVDLKPLDEGELRAALESILLVVDEPVAEMQLAQIMEQPTERIAVALEDISARYTAAGHGFDLRRAAGGWRLYTRPEYAPYVERFVLDGQTTRLTQAALETLAVVAYKQPVTRSRISAIRGVNCDGVMRTLVTRGLIEECGTEGETGAFLYRTTALFLEKLGLNSVDQLPPLAPFLPDDVEEVLDASG